MATSGTFTGSRGGGSTGPWLSLAWNRVDTDIPGNRSKIRLTLTLHASHRINFSASKSGSLHGQSFTYSGGFSGTGSKVIQTRDVWISHNSDGSKSQAFSASFNIAITYSGSYVGSLTVNGTAVIDDLPRASDFTAFSLSNTTLNTNTANTITYTLSKKYSTYSHLMTLKVGSKTIKSWTDSGTGSSTESLTAAQVNEIIAERPNHTSGTLTLTMQTRSGTTNIGAAVSRNITFSISSAVVPTASGISVSIDGSGRDYSINRFIQNLSKVRASFTRTAGYGATISSSTIVIRRVAGAADSQTISSHSGTTANAVSLSGIYEAIGTVRDSRGRTATSRTTFTVDEYSNPRIISFTARRNQSVTSTVMAGINLVYSPIGGHNPATITLVGVNNQGTKVTHRNNTGQTAGSLNTTQNITNQSDASRFTYTLTVEDSFGGKAEATVAVGTSFIELSIARGKGIGVGKVHEEGALDVFGTILVGTKGSSGKLVFDAHTTKDEYQIIQRYPGRGDTSYLWFREDAAGFWDKSRNRGAWRYDLVSGLFEIEAAAGLRVNQDVTASNMYAYSLTASHSTKGGNVEMVTNTIRNNSSALYLGNGTGVAELGGGWAVLRIGTTNWSGSGSNSGLMYFGRDASEMIWSPTIYNRTYGSAANMHITNFGTLGRSTSASKYKLVIERPELDGVAERILELNPSTWYDKGAVERFSAYLTAVEDGKNPQLIDIPYIERQYGLIAEDLVDAGLEMFVQYGDPDSEGNREVESIEYDRLWIFLIPLVKELKNKVKCLEAKLDAKAN